ncbi:MAG: hypothetical protein Q9196_006862 [Gyalolechia fulgens]
MARSESSSLTPPPPEMPAKPTRKMASTKPTKPTAANTTITTTATRYSKRKRGEAPSPLYQPDVTPAPPSKKRRPAPINTSGKRLPKKPAATKLPSYIQQRVAPAAPIYASPWAHVSAEHWQIDDTHAPNNVKMAFAVQKLIGRPHCDWEQEAGLAVWYRHVNHEAGTYVRTESICMQPIVGATWIAGYGQICWRDQIAAAKPVRRGKANAPRTRSTMEVFREGDGDDAEFFLVWEKMDDVKINGTGCVPDDPETTAFAAGPLPRFAVIEVEETIIFWFRDAGAMDYTTPEIEQMELDADLLGYMQEEFEQGEAAEEEEEQEDSLTEEERRERSHEWRKIWLRGIQARMAECENDNDVPKPTHIHSTSDLHGEDVVAAIACLWRTVDHELGRPFAIHDYINYYLVRGKLLDEQGYREKVPAAIHGPNDLLIPITFNSFHQSPPNSATFEQSSDSSNDKSQPASGNGKGKKAQDDEVGRDGHILFALAQKREGSIVNVQLYDSCPGFIAKSRIMTAVSRTVQKIGWLGMDHEGWAVELEQEPDVIEEKEVSVPIQEGIQTCGIYTILNGWMVLLGLPALNQRRREHYRGRRSGQQDAENFLNWALEMINCALAGHMDLETVQAFFNWFGYCGLQDPEDAEVRLGSGYVTARMNARILNEILDVERAIGQATTEHAVDQRRFLQGSIEAVKEQTGCSHSTVMRLLELTDGNVDEAVSLHLAETTE